MKAILKTETSELETIYNLSESHSPGLRLKTLLQYENLNNIANDVNKVTPQSASKEALIMKCPLEPVENKIKQMLKYIEEMPEGMLQPYFYILIFL